MIKKIIALTIFLIITATIVVTIWVFNLMDYRSPADATLFFEKGTALRSMSEQLFKQKVLPKKEMLEIMIRLQGKEKAIKAGEYEFKKGLTPTEVASIIIKGKVKLYPITVPEGYNLNQIKNLLIEKGIIDAQDWENAVNDKEFIDSFDLPFEGDYLSLEGYLFPDTYNYQRNIKAKDFIKMMIDHFKKKVSQDMILAAKEKGFSFHQWVTLASIIEKETGLGSERPLIASVFMNRLKKGMLLQTDPTVIYGIKNFDGNLTRKHLETRHPYNTYTEPGLPPGPICSPGIDSLKAVLNPEEASFIYFVAKGDGSHYFSRTLEEHNQAVNFYQLKRGNAPTSENN